MTKLDTILFDLGHTLIDFRPKKEDFIEVYRQAREQISRVVRGTIPPAEELAEHLPRKISEIVDNSYQGENAIEELSMSEVVKQAFASVGIILPRQLLHEMLLLEHESLSRSMVLADGAGEVLAQLKDWGFKLGLVSNATNLPALLRRDLERMNILHHFDATVFSSEVGLRKPHPKIYRTALQGVGSEPTTTVFVGDRIREDIQGPQSLGMRAVLTHQFRQENPDSSLPDGLIKDVSEMLDLARQLGPR